MFTSLKLLGAAVALAGAAAPVRADPMARVQVVHTGREPACLAVDELAAAIGRDVGLPAEVVSPEVPAASDAAQVRVRGDDLFLSVAIDAGTRRVREDLEAPACAATADAVAALVASVLVSLPVAPPDRPLAPAAPVPAPPRDPCPIGSPCQRAELLEDSLKGYAISQRLLETAGMWEGMLGLTGASLHLALREEPDLDAAGALVLCGAGLWVAGGVGSLILHDSDHAGTVASTSFLAGLGTIVLAGAYTGELHDKDGAQILPDQRHDGLLIAGLALYGTAGVLLADRLAHRPIAVGRLVADYQRVRTPERRAALGAAEVHAIERNFRRTSSPTSIWLLTAPLWAGAVAALAHSLGEHEAGERKLDYVVAADLAAVGLVGLCAGYLDPYRHYQRSLAIGPGGTIGLAGTW